MATLPAVKLEMFVGASWVDLAATPARLDGATPQSRVLWSESGGPVQIVRGVGDGDLGFAQCLAGLQYVLLGRNFLFPQVFFALVGGLRQLAATLGRLQFGARLGHGRAQDDR